MAPEYDSSLSEVWPLYKPNITEKLGLDPYIWKASYGNLSEINLPIPNTSLILIEPRDSSESDNDLGCFRVGEDKKVISSVSVEPLLVNELGENLASDTNGQIVSVSAVNLLSGTEIEVTTRIHGADFGQRGFEEIIILDDKGEIFKRMSASHRLVSKGGVVLIPRFRRSKKGVLYILPISEFINEGSRLQEMRDILTSQSNIL